MRNYDKNNSFRQNELLRKNLAQQMKKDDIYIQEFDFISYFMKNTCENIKTVDKTYSKINYE